MKHAISLRPWLLPALLALGLPGPALAEALQLTTEAFQEVVVKDKSGKPEKTRQKVTNALPGTEIIYVVSYRNGGAKPAANVVVNNPVPPSLAYQAGSAQGSGARAEVSVDGGRQFGALETLRVVKEDGSLRPAQGADVTHVRWTVLAPVPAGKGGIVSYRALVK